MPKGSSGKGTTGKGGGISSITSEVGGFNSAKREMILSKAVLDAIIKNEPGTKEALQANPEFKENWRYYKQFYSQLYNKYGGSLKEQGVSAVSRSDLSMSEIFVDDNGSARAYKRVRVKLI